MSLFTPYPIETCDTWNEVLARGIPVAEMPPPGLPGIYIEHIPGFVEIWAAASNAGVYYATLRKDYADGGFEQQSYIPPHETILGGVTLQAKNLVLTDGNPKTGEYTFTRSGPIDFIAEYEAGIAEMDANGLDWDTMDIFTPLHFGGYDLAERIVVDNVVSIYPQKTWGRIRFKIPLSHTGSYFKIKWDYKLTPESGDPSVINGDEIIWAGPGDPNNYSDAGWFTPWQYVDPPSTNGMIELCNLQYWNLSSSPYGIRPNQDLMLIQPGQTVMDMSKAANSMYQPLL